MPSNLFMMFQLKLEFGMIMAVSWEWVIGHFGPFSGHFGPIWTILAQIPPNPHYKFVITPVYINHDINPHQSLRVHNSLGGLV